MFNALPAQAFFLFNILPHRVLHGLLIVVSVIVGIIFNITLMILERVRAHSPTRLHALAMSAPQPNSRDAVFSFLLIGSPTTPTPTPKGPSMGPWAFVGYSVAISNGKPFRVDGVCVGEAISNGGCDKRPNCAHDAWWLDSWSLCVYSEGIQNRKPL